MTGVCGWLKHFIQNKRGVSTVEFALVAPMLIAAMVGVADFGLAVNEKMRLVSAARAGAQAGFSNSGNQAAMQAAVLAASGLNASSVTVNSATICGCADGSTLVCTATCADGSNLRTYVTVTVTELYSLLLSYPGFPSQQSFSATSTLRIN